MACPKWPWLAGWLLLASSAAGQFNDTFRTTITAMDPMTNLDTDDTRYNVWNVDDVSGYRSNEWLDAWFVCHFVATGYDASGVAWWRTQDEGVAANNTLRYQSEPASDGPTGSFSRTLEVGHMNGTYLGAMSGLELAAYELNVSHTYNTAVIFHNISLSIPIRSQA